MSHPISAAAAAAVPISASAKCPICLDDMRDRSVAIPCCHDFDFRCISEWLSVNSNCPVCRTPMECIHHSIKSITSFAVQNVVPTASAHADHGHEEYEDSELDFDSDDMDGDTLSFLDGSEEFASIMGHSDSSLMSLPAPDFTVDEDDSLHSYSQSPPASPDSNPGSEANGTIVVSDDSDHENDDQDIYSDTTEELDETPADLFIDEESGVIEVVPQADEDDGVVSENDSVSIADYGDEPDEWSDDFDDAPDEFEDDYGDGFDEDSPADDW